jgi:hypothetical protein
MPGMCGWKLFIYMMGERVSTVSFRPLTARFGKFYQLHRRVCTHADVWDQQSYIAVCLMNP